MHTLHIDTTNYKVISVGLEIDGKKDLLTRQLDSWKAQVVLPMIDELLKKHMLNISNINAINIKQGPGSFTGLRVGVAIGNTLGAWLNISVNGKPVGETIVPVYQ